MSDAERKAESDVAKALHGDPSGIEVSDEDIASLFDASSTLDIPYPDPEYHYRWVNRFLPQRIARFIRAGYGPVAGEEAADRIYGKGRGKLMLDANGRVSYDDLILMQVPNSVYDRIQAMKRSIAKRALGAGTDEFMAALEPLKKSGVTGFVQTVEEAKDRRAFDTRESNNRVFISKKGAS